MNQPKFEIHRARNKEFYFVLKSRNGKVIATGETYKSKQGVVKAMKAIHSFCTSHWRAENMEIIDKTKGPK